MLPISIIILTKNEEKNIERTLMPLIGLTDDLIIVDNGSTDHTISIAKKLGVQVINMEWQGYSKTKNNAHRHARFDWILSIDADEEINTALKLALHQLFTKTPDEKTAFAIQRKMVYCGTVLHYGAVGNEFRLRLFNRKNARWNENTVHEDITFTQAVKISKLDGFVWHHSYDTIAEHEQKIEHYAQLFAQQKKQEGRTFSIIKKKLSPVFGFIKNYIFRLGFLDGSQGFHYAKIEMKYSFRKYELTESANQ